MSLIKLFYKLYNEKLWTIHELNWIGYKTNRYNDVLEQTRKQRTCWNIYMIRIDSWDSQVDHLVTTFQVNNLHEHWITRALLDLILKVLTLNQSICYCKTIWQIDTKHFSQEYKSLYK